MKLKFRSSECGDSSLLDLFAIIAAVAIVAGVFFLPALAKSKARPKQINCVNNLKQVGLSFRIWAGDNGDKMPSQVPTNQGGAMEFVGSGVVFPIFAVMSNELGTPKIVLCPGDTKRSPATNFTTSLHNTNISYFAVPEADETLPNLWFSGDRNLATNNRPLHWGLFSVSSPLPFDWTSQMHSNKGNLCFADGSVQQYNSLKLRQSVTNWFAVTNMPFSLLIP